jgi:hypothetical protein
VINRIPPTVIPTLRLSRSRAKYWRPSCIVAAAALYPNQTTRYPAVNWPTTRPVLLPG